MARIPYFDAHCDTVTTFRPLRENRGHLDLTRLLAYDGAAQVFALWAPPGLDRPAVFRRYVRRWQNELARNRDTLVHCRSAAEARSAMEQGKVAGFLAVEGATLLGCSVAGLSEARRLGVRLVTLTWNCSNVLAGAAMDRGGGLTEAGARFVAAAWELGVAVDLSHASESTFWDVLRAARRPVICSHSNARALCDHPRNLTDAQITALIGSGGCLGLNLYPEFLGGGDMEAVLAQIDHILCLDGRKALCLGADWDGVEALPEGLGGVEALPRLYETLLRRNWGEALVRDIFFHNLLRFMEESTE